MSFIVRRNELLYHVLFYSFRSSVGFTKAPTHTDATFQANNQIIWCLHVYKHVLEIIFMCSCL